LPKEDREFVTFKTGIPGGPAENLSIYLSVKTFKTLTRVGSIGVDLSKILGGQTKIMGGKKVVKVINE